MEKNKEKTENSKTKNTSQAELKWKPVVNAERNPIIIIVAHSSRLKIKNSSERKKTVWGKFTQQKQPRLFQLSALIKMFSYINNRQRQSSNTFWKSTRIRGGNVFRNWNQNTNRKTTWYKNVCNPCQPIGQVIKTFWPILGYQWIIESIEHGPMPDRRWTNKCKSHTTLTCQIFIDIN